jgi:hypothetical protein
MTHSRTCLVGLLVTLSIASGCAVAESSAETSESALTSCTERELAFSADSFVDVQADNVWGGNANGGSDVLYSSEFLARAQDAHANNAEVFAYLEGPCGDTGGVDDGERSRCADAHNAFNEQNAPGTSDTPEERWKPFTFKQLTESASSGVDYCEIDNLNNNINVPLNPLLKEIKSMYDAGEIHCRLVLKNIDVEALDSIRSEVASTPEEAKFLAPFHIFEADDTGQKGDLDVAMERLKGPGAVTVVSTDTNHYGSAFTQDKFRACK